MSDVGLDAISPFGGLLNTQTGTSVYIYGKLFSMEYVDKLLVFIFKSFMQCYCSSILWVTRANQDAAVCILFHHVSSFCASRAIWTWNIIAEDLRMTIAVWPWNILAEDLGIKIAVWPWKVQAEDLSITNRMTLKGSSRSAPSIWRSVSCKVHSFLRSVSSIMIDVHI